MTDGRIRAAKTIARETIDILESLVTNNGTDRAGAASTAASVTLLLTGLAGRNPTSADGAFNECENGVRFAASVLELLRDDVPKELHIGTGLKPHLPSYIPQEAEGHIMYGLTRLRSAIQNWTMLPGIDSAEQIQVGLRGVVVIGGGCTEVIRCGVIVRIFGFAGPEGRVTTTDVSYERIEGEVTFRLVVGADVGHGLGTSRAVGEDVGVLIHIDAGSMEELLVEYVVGTIVDHSAEREVRRIDSESARSVDDSYEAFGQASSILFVKATYDGAVNGATEHSSLTFHRSGIGLEGVGDGRAGHAGRNCGGEVAMVNKVGSGVREDRYKGEALGTGCDLSVTTGVVIAGRSFLSGCVDGRCPSAHGGLGGSVEEYVGRAADLHIARCDVLSQLHRIAVEHFGVVVGGNGVEVSSQCTTGVGAGGNQVGFEHVAQHIDLVVNHTGVGSSQRGTFVCGVLTNDHRFGDDTVVSK